ncbi:murein hydrolase activator EnvC family protein [Bacillus suaedae]|uniref:Peptidoglycan DD-metalloendopeptidase family protein n=1 Tax=Halalkalibacter suaedae TaxID=2822140 RepID=A0A940WT84_9BACI|nr:peptidoglycan DD-metalloendopeptidase family protein [Bacillus suaedae]MBP3950002.1 peptidoglycan DD-metalloendopeptidase family protein [Bacillus suaedae]
MKRKIWLTAIAILITSASFGGNFTNNALANSELQEQISEVEGERAEKQGEAEKTQAELEKIDAEKQELNDEIKRIDHETALTNQQVREKRDEISTVQKEIETLQEEIIILEERIAKRDELLKERARTMYQTGGSVDYLEVILGAKTFSDFVSRVSALSVIAQQDRDILDKHISDQEQLAEAKAQVEQELVNLESHLAELEELMATLETQRQEKGKVMADLQAKEDDLHAELGELEDADEILRSQEAALKSELAAYEERMKREAEARKASESAQPSTTSRGSNEVHSAPEATGSGFIRPATGRMSSGFGYRSFDNGMHYGIDIGKNGRSGDVPIVAVADGTVIRSYYSSSYGNTVLIAHVVDGRSITTLYAHLERRDVSTGQRVSQGERIGLMGNTGQSFGAHLHFEVHEGGWNGAKSNAVDPLKYIPR